MLSFVFLLATIGQPAAPPPGSYAACYAQAAVGNTVTFVGTPPGLPYGTYTLFPSAGRVYIQSACPGGRCPLKPQGVK